MSYEIVGPFDSYVVVVDGKRVPFLEARPENGGMVSVTLDHRMGLDLDVQTAETVIPFLAHCIAVGMGYACHGGNERPPFPSMTELGGTS